MKSINQGGFIIPDGAHPVIDILVNRYWCPPGICNSVFALKRAYWCGGGYKVCPEYLNRQLKYLAVLSPVYIPNDANSTLFWLELEFSMDLILGVDGADGLLPVVSSSRLFNAFIYIGKVDHTNPPYICSHRLLTAEG